MENQLQHQILEAAATLLTGFGLGLLYQVLGALRRHCGRPAVAALDVLFCAVFAGALFCLGMGPAGGQLRLYMPLLALGGMAVWGALFGRRTRLLTEKMILLIGKCVDILRIPLREIKKNR